MALLPFDRVREGLRGDPSIYPQNVSLAHDAILFLRLARPAFKAASFLDDRILTPQTEGRWVPFGELAPLMEAMPAPLPLHFIFHAGHVGSTLVSRLLDEAGGVLGLREPLPLRVLAEAADESNEPSALVDARQTERLLRWFLALWARGYAEADTIVLKATSSAGRLAPVLLAHAPRAQAITMNLKPEPYLATLLSGENSYIDLRGHGPERYKRLSRLAAAAPPAPLSAMSLGEIAALTWLVETLTQAELRQAYAERVLPLDFDEFLDDPTAAMRSVCAHFALSPPGAFFDSIRNSPVLHHYSKAPDQAYTPAFRAKLLAQSRNLNTAEISNGMRWLEGFARRSPAAARALSA